MATLADYFAKSSFAAPEVQLSRAQMFTDQFPSSQQILAAYGGRMPVGGEPVNRALLQALLSKPQMGTYDGEGNYIPPSGVEERQAYLQNMLSVLDAYGVDSTDQLPEEVRAQLPHQGRIHDPGQSFGEQFVDYVTSAPVLLAAAGLGGVLAGGAGAAGGSGSVTGASGELAAGGSAAYGGSAGGTAGATTAFDDLVLGSDASWGVNAEPLGTGLTTGAGGQTGLTAGATTGQIGGEALGGGIGTGAGSAATGAASGTALAPGYFAAESLYPVAGGATASALGSSSGSGANQAAGSLGSSILDQFTSDPLGSALSAAPAVGALALANDQRKDVQPYLGRIDAILDRYAGNEPAYLQSLTDPYDLATGQRRAQLVQSQGLRGLSGSTFANEALGNFDYMRDVGRANLLAQGINQSALTQGGLIGQQLEAINKRNLASNALIGAGLGASGRLFSPTPNPFSDVFGLANLWQGY